MRAPPLHGRQSRRAAPKLQAQLLEALFEEQSDAVVITDERGSILLVNQEAERLFDYHRDELLSEPLELLLPESRIARRKDGSTVSVDVRTSDIATETGPLMMACVRDVTSREIAEKQERLLATLSLVIMEAEDTRAALTAVLRHVLEMTGWSYGESLLPHADGSGLQIAAVAHRGEPALVEFGEASERALLPYSSVPGISLTSRRPVWIPDLSAEPAFLRRSEANEAGLNAAVFVPALSANEGIVVFGLFAEHPLHRDATTSPIEAMTRLGPLIARKRTEQELKERELQLAEAQAVARIGSWEWDLAANRVTWSDELSRIYGLEPGAEEITYRAFLDRIHPAERDGVDRIVQTAFRTHEAFSFDHRIVRPDGGERVLHAEGRVVLDAAGLPARMVGTGQDVTDTKRAQDALRTSEERVRSILETANDAFVSIDAEGVITAWNRQAQLTFGWSRDEAVGRKLVDTIIPARHREAHVQGLRRFLDTGDGPVLNQPVELSALGKDGVEFPVELTIWALEEDGGFTFNAFIRDMTDRRRSEERIAQQAALLDLAHDAILVRDFDGVIRFWSRGAEEVYGWTAEEAVGRLSYELLKTASDELTLPDIEDEVLRDGRWEGELLHTCRDGRHIVVASRWALQPGSGELQLGALQINTDITDRKLAEEALAQKTLDLERSNADLAEFAYAASHDLQEPLRMVSSYVQLLAERYGDHLDHEATEFIDFAVDGARRMRSLIADLLSYSEVGTAETSLVEIDANELLTEILSMLDPLIKESGAVVETGPLPVVVADRTQLGQVFQNLLSNAIKFTRPAARIGVRAIRERTWWRFVVTDNGIGVDPRYVERIFRPFKRLHTREEYPGTGLGLSVCKRAVERRGGRMWVEPALDGGSAFNFTIPHLAVADADE